MEKILFAAYSLIAVFFYTTLLYSLFYTMITEGRPGILRCICMKILGVIHQLSDIWNDEMAWYREPKAVPDYPKTLISRLEDENRGMYEVFWHFKTMFNTAFWVLFIGGLVFGSIYVFSLSFNDLNWSVTGVDIRYTSGVVLILNTFVVVRHYGAFRVVQQIVVEKEKRNKKRKA